jgi:transcriptional regulator with XRE-family HTH domain
MKEQKVRNERKTQTQVAEKLEMAQSNYAVWESGRTDITIGKLAKLAEIFNSSVAEILGLEGGGKESEEIARLQQEVERLNGFLQDREELLKRLRAEEQRFNTAIDKLMSSLFTAYLKWYQEAFVGAEQFSTPDTLKWEQDFWGQFFALEGSKYAVEAGLVNDVFFISMFERYKKTIQVQTSPFAKRLNEHWDSFFKGLKTHNFEIAERTLAEINKHLRTVSFTLIMNKLPF